MKGLIFFVKNYEISKLCFTFVRKREDKHSLLIYIIIQSLLTIKQIYIFNLFNIV